MKEMLIIHKAQFMRVPHGRHEIHKMAHFREPVEYMDSDMGGVCGAQEVESELIEARHYSRMGNDKLETWLVGFDEETCDLLEMLPTNELKEYEALKSDYKIKVMEVNEFFDDSRELHQIKQSTFWDRLKNLFVGY